MPLFQQNSEPILFHLINLEDAERAALTELIESEGGGVTDDDNVTVKFTSRDAYVRNGPLVRAKIYDITFIKECVQQKKIVRPEDYRLDKQIGQDNFYVHHFLHGTCQDARYPVQCQCGRRQEERVRSQSVYSLDTLADSEASMEQPTSIAHESTDESQQVLSALDLKVYASALAGGDSAACYDNGEKRPCNVEYELKFKPTEAFHRIEDCATEDAGSLLNGDREDCRDSSRNWYENPSLSKVESLANVKQELDDDWTNIDMPGQVAVLNIIPEARMLTHDITVVSPTTSQNDHWIPARNEITSNAQRKAESTDRETETPDLELVPATNNHPETLRVSDNGGEPMDTESKHRIEKSRERSHASSGKPGQCKRKKSENKEVDGDRERNSSTVEAQGAKKVHRRLPKFRESQKADDISDNSSISSSEAAIGSQEITDDTASTILSELELISDGNSEDDRRSHRYRRRNANAAGPSGVHNTRRGHVGDERASNGRSRVRNIAHPSFLTNLNEVDDEIEDPEAQYSIAKKSSRGKEWRAKLKSQTDAQYTGTKSRIPFSSSERRTMLRYLIKNKCINRAKGLVVWKKMITDGYLTDRTPQSLQNHFRKCILPNIEDADWLENSDRVKFLALRSDQR